MRILLEAVTSIEHGVRFGAQDTSFVFGINSHVENTGLCSIRSKVTFHADTKIYRAHQNTNDFTS